MYSALRYMTASLLPPLYGSYALTTERTSLVLQSCTYAPTNCKGSPWVIIASSPASCSPLKGVLAGVALGQTFASSSGPRIAQRGCKAHELRNEVVKSSGRAEK